MNKNFITISLFTIALISSDPIKASEPFFKIAPHYNVGDGIPDLAVTNSYSDDISILMQLEDSTFVYEDDLISGNNPCSITCGDFDSNGHIDLAVCNHDNISIHFGVGDGSFLDAVYYSTGYSRSLTTSDFNNDGNLDIAVVNYDSVSVLLGNPIMQHLFCKFYQRAIRFPCLNTFFRSPILH